MINLYTFTEEGEKRIAVTCGSCKHWSHIDGTDGGVCEKITNNTWTELAFPQIVGSVVYTKRDFACALFEKL